MIMKTLLLCLVSIFFNINVFVAPQKRTIHLFVALADNAAQGIVPVPAAIGNGQDAARNLYWGARYGIKNYFSKSAAWQKQSCIEQQKSEPVLERCVFIHRSSGVELVAEAYQGPAIGKAITDFMNQLAQPLPSHHKHLSIFVGHNALMDAPISPIAKNFPAASPHATDAMVFACFSARYFQSSIKTAGASPLVLTYGLMAPEAYVVEAAVASWLRNESEILMAQKAAQAYGDYQKIKLSSAKRLFGVP